MKQSEIKEASTTELQEHLTDSSKAYVDLKMAHAISPLENPIQLKTQRRSIARIETELTKREVQK
jgi:large subunit ribosomal protein L29